MIKLVNIEIRWLLERNSQCKLQRHINQEKDTADKTKQTTRITIEKHRKKGNGRYTKTATEMSRQRKPKSELLSRLGLFKRHFKWPHLPLTQHLASPRAPSPYLPPPRQRNNIMQYLFHIVCVLCCVFFSPFNSFSIFLSCALRLICWSFLLPSHFNLNKTFVLFKHIYLYSFW